MPPRHWQRQLNINGSSRLAAIPNKLNRFHHLPSFYFRSRKETTLGIQPSLFIIQPAVSRHANPQAPLSRPGPSRRTASLFFRSGFFEIRSDSKDQGLHKRHDLPGLFGQDRKRHSPYRRRYHHLSWTLRESRYPRRCRANRLHRKDHHPRPDLHPLPHWSSLRRR